MKRSKMLEYMEFTISDYLGEKINHPDVLAELLLKEVEEAGMAPPFYDKIQDNNGEKVLIPAREWEDEWG